MSRFGVKVPPVAGLLLLSIVISAPAAEDDGFTKDSIGVSPWRQHGDTLSGKDFVGDVPKKRPSAQVKILGYAFIAIRYDFRASFAATPTQVTATLTELDLFSAIDRKTSWLELETPALLDHLQGHFDLVEIEARKARKIMRRRLDEGSVIRGFGKDENAAIADLQKNVEEALLTFHQRATKSREQFDKTTRHGTLKEKLRIERQKHQAALTDKRGF
jgi:hypothetical protein